MTRHARQRGRWAARLLTVLCISVALAGFPMLARAQHGGGAGGNWHGGGGWHGNVRDWHGGHWFHGWYGGRVGWWWYVPGYDWYSYYDAPIYPYPPYPDAAPSPNVLYYCQDPAGYYPYVQQCAGPWQPVPAPGG